MAQINGLTIIHTTANVVDAGCDSSFQLQVVTPGGDVVRNFPDLPHNERERGRTDQYFFNLSGAGVDSDTPVFQVRMMILDDDGWLPSSIFVIGHRPGGGTVLLGSHPTWKKGSFDSGNNAGGPAQHVVSGSS